MNEFFKTHQMLSRFREKRKTHTHTYLVGLQCIQGQAVRDVISKEILSSSSQLKSSIAEEVVVKQIKVSVSAY